jgi:hypothetical protein
MPLNQLKIPILSSINDVPSTEGQPEHPNAPYVLNRYHQVIDILSGTRVITDTTFLIDPNNSSPNNTTTFSSFHVFLSYLKNSSLQFTTGAINIEFSSTTHYLGNFQLELSVFDGVTEEVVFNITSEDPENRATLVFDYFSSPYPVVFDNLIFSKCYFENSQLTFNSETTFATATSYFYNCKVEFEGDTTLSITSSEPHLIFSNSYLLSKSTNQIFVNLINSVFNNAGELYQALPPVIVTPKIRIIADTNSEILITRSLINLLDIEATNSSVSIVDSILDIDSGVDSNKSLKIVLKDSNLFISKTEIENGTNTLLTLINSNFYFHKSTLTLAGTNQLNPNNSTVISERDSANLVNTAIDRFGTLTSTTAILFEDGIFIPII